MLNPVYAVKELQITTHKIVKKINLVEVAPGLCFCKFLVV